MTTVLINLAWFVAILVIISLLATYFFMDDFQKSYNFIFFNKKNIMVRYIRKYLNYFQNTNKTTSLNPNLLKQNQKPIPYFLVRLSH